MEQESCPHCGNFKVLKGSQEGFTGDKLLLAWIASGIVIPIFGFFLFIPAVMFMRRNNRWCTICGYRWKIGG